MKRASIAASTLLLAITQHALAGPSAATNCPNYWYNGSTNLALNDSFERPSNPSLAVSYNSAQLLAGGPFLPSAAAGWNAHSSNAGAPISMRLVPSHAPGPNGQYMLEVRATGVESGVNQILNAALPPNKKRMFSVWVFVVSGKVSIQAQAFSSGPTSTSTKTGEWEQLRVCTDGTVPSNYLVVYNQAAGGGTFYVDRAELRDQEP